MARCATIDGKRVWWRFRTSFVAREHCPIRGSPGYHWSCLSGVVSKKNSDDRFCGLACFLRGTLNSTFLRSWRHLRKCSDTSDGFRHHCQTTAKHKEDIANPAKDDSGSPLGCSEHACEVASGLTKLRGNLEAASLKHLSDDRTFLVLDFTIPFKNFGAFASTGRDHKAHDGAGKI